jgi:hypothetical protein
MTNDRRNDKTTLNLMQRVFDALGNATAMLTIDELAERLRIEPQTIGYALQRLRRYRSLRSHCMDGEWRYGLPPGAERPIDRRGGPRQMVGEIAA